MTNAPNGGTYGPRQLQEWIFTVAVVVVARPSPCEVHLFSTIHGLPLHVLLVHVIVVLLPLSAVLLVLSAVLPRARRRLAGPNALLALGVVALVPVTTSAGEWLQSHVNSGPLVRHHADLGDTAIWVALPIAVLAVLMWWRDREIAVTLEGQSPAGGERVELLTHRRTLLAPTSARITAALAVASVLAAGLAIFDVYRIGDSGAKAAWHGGYQAQAR
jgi:hypothetical protein